ncbi:MAG: beta-hydroxyacyl-ACP dehydratase [Planctomycetota bacterium]|nr:beta-hydroxyacyl-ACP dehydratase [Planctomycetota bacterium]
MRWIWIDRILELEKAKRCVAIKNVSLAEEVLHDHFPAAPGRPRMPVLPNPLIIEGMAQTAGILVGHANDFAEKVILAKVGRATFTAAAWPGYTLRYTADIERMDSAGASTRGTVDRIDPGTGQTVPLATIELLFSHIDQNRSGLAFPDHNFVFTDQFMDLLRQSGFAVK